MGVEINIFERFSGWKFSILAVFQVFLVFAILVSLAIALWRYQNTDFSTVDSKRPVKDSGDFAGPFLASESKPLSFYTDMTTLRDIFQFGSADSGIVAVAADLTSPAQGDFGTRYIVQGIIFDKNPQAIIKDTQSSKTYFVHRKETLDGAVLENIEGNRVIFKIQGQSVELIKK